MTSMETATTFVRSAGTGRRVPSESQRTRLGRPVNWAKEVIAEAKRTKRVLIVVSWSEGKDAAL
jgi:hypothetical protein